MRKDTQPCFFAHFNKMSYTSTGGHIRQLCAKSQAGMAPKTLGAGIRRDYEKGTTETERLE